MRCRPAAVIDHDLVHEIGYSPTSASVVLDYEDYEPDRVFIDFVEALRAATEEHEDG